MIRFTVYGLPQPGGSKRTVPVRNRHGIVTRADGSPLTRVIDDNPKAADWKNAIRSEARKQYNGPLLSGALAVMMMFYRPRKRSDFRTGRRAGELKESAPKFWIQRPDVLKLARPVEDALTGVLWVDDAQIVRELLDKQFGEPARVEIRVQVMT